MKHFNVTFRPDGKQISIHAGATLIEAADKAGIVLSSVCGGQGVCEKCLVNLEPDQQPVLACQYKIQTDLTITIPPTSRFFEQKILAHGIDPQVPPTVYKELAKTAIAMFGLAVDIGTTTIVAKLIDMTTGRCLATQADINPQTQYGDDVISRIAYAQTDEKLNELHKIIIRCINNLVETLCRQASIDPMHIYEMCVVGNTTMGHIFLKLPIVQLGQAPYKAYSLDSFDRSAEEMAVNINPAANVHTVANIAGFVGSDTTAVALAVDIASTDEMTLVVDIGTNGEVVLGSADKLYAASCAAGPAFEGARISHGSRAMEGAIEAVVYNENDIDSDVIGATSPRSICGSGLVDAVAILLELGIIDQTGRFRKPNELPQHLSSAILSRIVERNNQPAFVLAHGKDKAAPTVTLTQADIRQVQLAKAAIRTGISMLQKRIGLEDSDIRHILLAGAFGNYIRAESALRIGLLPKVPLERIRFVGNAACSGAQMVLLNRRSRSLADELARKIEYIEIAHEPDFGTIYADSMMF